MKSELWENLTRDDWFEGIRVYFRDSSQKEIAESIHLSSLGVVHVSDHSNEDASINGTIASGYESTAIIPQGAFRLLQNFELNKLVLEKPPFRLSNVVGHFKASSEVYEAFRDVLKTRKEGKLDESLYGNAMRLFDEFIGCRFVLDDNYHRLGLLPKPPNLPRLCHVNGIEPVFPLFGVLRAK